MPAYKDKRSGRWRYRKRVTLPDGRRVRIEGTPATDTKKAAEHAEQMHVLRLTNPSMVPKVEAPSDAVPFLRDYADVFLDNYEPDQKPSAKHSKRQIVRAHLKPFFGHMRLDEIRQIDVDSFKKAQRDAGLAPKTINNRLGVLSTLLEYARENLGFEGREMRFHVRGSSAKIEAVAMSDVAKLLAACEDPRYRAAILLASDAGLRIGEIRALQWGAIVDSRIVVRLAVDTRNNVGDPKHDKIRKVPVSASLAAALAAVPRRGLWVVSRLDGGLLGYCAMREIIHDVYDAAGVDSPLMPWHCLRHTFGTELAKREPLPVVCKLMGHSDVKTTMRYVTVVESQERDAIDRAFRR